MQVGDYVRVVAVPAAWGGSGESDEERRALLGLIGTVLEVCPAEQMVHVGFLFPSSASINDDGVRYCNETLQVYTRNIEQTAVSILYRPEIGLHL